MPNIPHKTNCEQDINDAYNEIIDAVNLQAKPGTPQAIALGQIQKSLLTTYLTDNKGYADLEHPITAYKSTAGLDKWLLCWGDIECMRIVWTNEPSDILILDLPELPDHLKIEVKTRR